MIGWDRHLEAWQVANRAGFLNPVFEGLSYAGEFGAVWLGLAALLAVTRRRPRVLVLTVAAELLAELCARGLEAAIPRARPHVHALVARPTTHSFPSGHATSAFACATVISLAAPRWRVPLFVLAAAIAWSRVYVGVHYPLDVLGGAALGTALGLGVTKALPRLVASRRRSRRAPRSG